MKGYVIDCSFSSALFLPDEKSELISSFFEKITENDRIYIPQLWWYETSNVLNIAVRKKRITHHEVIVITKLFDNMNLETDFESGSIFTREIFNLAQEYQLSSYDSVYLELAMRKNGILMTLDEELINAAKKAGVDCGYGF